jgi:hypothetical protein
VDFNRLVHEILAGDEMRYVEIIGEEGELIQNKMKDGKYSVKEQRKEELLTLDLYNTKKAEQKFNKILGNTTFTHVSRKKLNQLIWYHNNLIIYCTCEPNLNHSKIIKIKEKIEEILGITQDNPLPNVIKIPN